MKRRILLVALLLIASLGITATPAYAPTWCPPSMTSGEYWMSSRAGAAHTVSAELGWTGDAHGQLRTRTSEMRMGQHNIGPWETFRLVCVDGPNVYAIQSVANGSYVSAELGWSGSSYGLLRARATSIGPWEKFRFSATQPYEVTTIQSTANGQYVSAEVGWTGTSYGLLRARASSPGQWEQFFLW